MENHIRNIPAVILAAGEGLRLRDEDVPLPKPLTHVLGMSLLERTMVTCRKAGVERFFVIVGFMKDALREHVRSLAQKHGLEVEAVENPNWKLGNGTSASACAPHIKGPFFIMMCDHLFEPSILEKLVAADDGTEACYLAVDRRIDTLFDIDDGTKVQIDGNMIQDIDKGLQDFNAIDTGFFLCRPLLFPALEQAHKQKEYSLSGGIGQLIAQSRMRCVDVSGCFWHDVDTPEAMAFGEQCLKERE
ncbi:NTP transferase domain-containing protein [Thermodesulfobacteriota bacterium]